MRRVFVCLVCGGYAVHRADAAEVAEVDVIGSADAKWIVDKGAEI